MTSPGFASLAALDDLLTDLDVGESRRRQFGMVRGELERALQRDGLPVAARRSLRRLLEPAALEPYLRLAESGALRARRVVGGIPPTSHHTNEIRRVCLDLLREALGMPALRLGGGAVELHPTLEESAIPALRRQLGDYLGGPMSPAKTRLVAVLAVVLDAAPRSGELIGQRLQHLAEDFSALYIERRPQHGFTDDAVVEGEWAPTSPLTRAALEQWLAVREDLVRQAHGTSRLWVSLRANHDGLLDADGNAVMRPAGMPLEENGLITSYRVGRIRYPELRLLLPLKLERLRRTVAVSRTP